VEVVQLTAQRIDLYDDPLGVLPIWGTFVASDYHHAPLRVVTC
jgi:hypothetical protein